MTFTRIVRTGLSSTVSTPAIAAQWTMCVAPARQLVHRVGVEDVALPEREVRVVGEVGAAERVAVEVVDGDDLVVVDEAARERRADESGAAGDEDPLALKHAASVSTRYSTARNANCNRYCRSDRRGRLRRRVSRADGCAPREPTSRSPSAPRWTRRG